MQKIPTVFRRNPDDLAHVLSEVTPGCEWVLAGEGVATRKYDGTCVQLDDNGQWWARREVKPGKTPPPSFQPVMTDDVTGKTVGWEPIEQSPFVKAFLDAHSGASDRLLAPGTYELCGPKINGNPEGMGRHELVPHGHWRVMGPGYPLTYDTAREWVRELAHGDSGERGWEGIVWHHPDGRMAKLKGRDFQ